LIALSRQNLKDAGAGIQAGRSYLCKYAELQQRNPWRPDLTHAQVEAVTPVAQPIVRTHPETGRQALFISEHFTTRTLGDSATSLRSAQNDSLGENA
jgi:taurine dioxygenase